MALRFLSFFSILALSRFQAAMATSPSPAFSAGLETLQKQIGYQFKSVDLLRRAMTHPSYSLENYRALSLLGLSAMESASALSLLDTDPDASAAAVHASVTKIAGCKACFDSSKRLGMDKLVRVATGTSASSTTIVCGAYRAMFGAIAVDAGGIDDAAKVLWRVVDGRFLSFSAISRTGLQEEA